MSALSVFSGKCLSAICGEDTPHRDIAGTPLRTGDVVIIYTVRDTTEGERADYVPNGLSVVVSDEWTSHGDGSFVAKFGEPTYFVMGIKSQPIDESGEWRVLRVKGYEDVVAGEHWKDYGFNYQATPDTAMRAGAA